MVVRSRLQENGDRDNGLVSEFAEGSSASVDIDSVADRTAYGEPVPRRQVSKVPKLVVANRHHVADQTDRSRSYSLRYRAKAHRELPHVVKFSGGRSSGMLLFALLENRLLDPDRGDVIVFNNTASEHPGTYRFAKDCKEASTRFGVPFFWVEFQTYEDSRNGEWTRLPSYRLVNDKPRSEENPDGFHWRLSDSVGKLERNRMEHQAPSGFPGNLRNAKGTGGFLLASG